MFQSDKKIQDIQYVTLQSKAYTKNQYSIKPKQITNIKILEDGYPLHSEHTHIYIYM